MENFEREKEVLWEKQRERESAFPCFPVTDEKYHQLHYSISIHVWVCLAWMSFWAGGESYIPHVFIIWFVCASFSVVKIPDKMQIAWECAFCFVFQNFIFKLSNCLLFSFLRVSLGSSKNRFRVHSRDQINFSLMQSWIHLRRQSFYCRRIIFLFISCYEQ